MCATWTASLTALGMPCLTAELLNQCGVERRTQAMHDKRSVWTGGTCNRLDQQARPGPSSHSRRCASMHAVRWQRDAVTRRMLAEVVFRFDAFRCCCMCLRLGRHGNPWLHLMDRSGPDGKLRKLGEMTCQQCFTNILEWRLTLITAEMCEACTSTKSLYCMHASCW